METNYDITQEEYDRLLALHRNISYTQSEIDMMMRIVKANIDPNTRVCVTCNSSLSDFKQKLYGWLWANQDAIEQMFNESSETSNEASDDATESASKSISDKTEYSCLVCGKKLPDARFKYCSTNCKSKKKNENV